MEYIEILGIITIILLIILTIILTIGLIIFFTKWIIELLKNN